MNPLTFKIQPFTTFDRELSSLRDAVMREELREKRLRRVVRCLSAAVIINITCWGLYFWHLYCMYRH